jgi:hypothetical protein
MSIVFTSVVVAYRFLLALPATLGGSMAIAIDFL